MTFFFEYDAIQRTVEAEIERVTVVYDTIARVLPENQTLLPAIGETVVSLLRVRNSIIAIKAKVVEITTMIDRGNMFNDMLTKASTYKDARSAEMYIKVYILPWKNYLSPEYFPNTYQALPEMLANNWNMYEKSILLMELSEALRVDREALSQL